VGRKWVEGLSDIVEKHSISGKIRKEALDALEGSDMSKVLELVGTVESNEASAALKAVLAERITEYAVKALQEARKRNTKVGAAAIIIAARAR